jgi:hypothetical protein
MARPQHYKDFERNEYQHAWQRHSKCLRQLGLTKRSFSGLRSGNDVFFVEVNVKGKRESWLIEAGSIWDAKAEAIEKLCGGDR